MQAKTRKTVRIASAAMIAMAAAATAAQADSGLLVNGDFENGTVGFDPQVYGNSYWSGEYAHGAEGGHSLKTYAPYSQFAGSVAIQNNIAATAGKTYSLSGFMFSPTADFIASAGDFGLLELGFHDAGGALIGATISQHFTAANTPDIWTPYTLSGLAPAGTASMQVVIGYIQLSAAPLGAVYFDDLNLAEAVVTPNSTWIATGSGGWLSGANWQGGTVPNAIGATANFGSSITSAASVTIAGAGATAGTVTFNNALAYTIDGPGALTLDVASGNAALTVTGGSHAINAPLVLNDSTVANVIAGQTLSIGGSLNVGAGQQLSVTNGGTLRINSTGITGGAGSTVVANGGTLQADVDLGSNLDVVATAGEARFNASQHVRSLSVAANAKASLPDTATAHVLRTGSLTVDPSGTLELGDNAAVLDYTTGNSPATSVRTAIITGQTGGGKGFISSKSVGDARYTIGYAEASAIGSPTTFLGESGIDATTLLIRVTLKGDANLSGICDFNDLVSLAQNYNGTGKVWSDGDFDYSGKVDFQDLVFLAQNYNQSALTDISGFSADFAHDWALAQTLVPEPTTLGALAGVATLVLRRRRCAIA